MIKLNIYKKLRLKVARFFPKTDWISIKLISEIKKKSTYYRWQIINILAQVNEFVNLNEACSELVVGPISGQYYNTGYLEYRYGR